MNIIYYPLAVACLLLASSDIGLNIFGLMVNACLAVIFVTWHNRHLNAVCYNDTLERQDDAKTNN